VAGLWRAFHLSELGLFSWGGRWRETVEIDVVLFICCGCWPP
jgi:hypothetical protein